MSKMGTYKLDGYFDYVDPPLKRYWWQNGVIGVHYAHKETFEWISLFRLPEFDPDEDFNWLLNKQ